MRALKYVIECNGDLFGPFDTEREATDWALLNCGTPWRLCRLSVPEWDLS